MTSILPEVRDTIRAPASNHLPSLSIRVPRRVLTAGGITGRWPRISRKTSLKSNDYFLIVPFRLVGATPHHISWPVLDLSSAIISYLSVCLALGRPANEGHQWSSDVLSREILDLRKLIGKLWF